MHKNPGYLNMVFTLASILVLGSQFWLRAGSFYLGSWTLRVLGLV